LIGIPRNAFVCRELIKVLIIIVTATICGSSLNAQPRGLPYISGAPLSSRGLSSGIDFDYESDTAHAAIVDTAAASETSSTHGGWPSFIGGDMFLAPDAFTVHFSGRHPLTLAIGWGVEIRIHPVFAGTITGISEDDGLSNGGDALQYRIYYGGLMFGHYRFEIGQSRAPEGSQYNGNRGYLVWFFGTSGRFGSIFFVEPEIRIMAPVEATLIHAGGYGPHSGYLATQRFGLKDVFLGVSLRFGIGFH
jgi:hypothetical protein